MKTFEALSNPALLALIVVALRVLYAVLSRVVAPYPRARAAVEAVAALGPDVLRAVQQAASAATGRPVASLDARHPDDDREALRARAEAAERRVAELAAAAPPSAPVSRVDETTREGRATIAPGMHGLMVLALSLAIAGCASAPDAPGTTLGKIHGWWSAICSSGDEALSLAERTVTTLPVSDAGPGDASPRAPRDASVSAESGGGDL